MWARPESQWAQAAGQKALRPTPTKQARLVVWHLTFRVSLDVAAIAPAEIVTACERFGLGVDAWERQERAFGLLAKVYAKRAKIRGDRAAAVAPVRWAGLDLGNWTEPAGDDFAARCRP